jgi:hypothetical protein
LCVHSAPRDPDRLAEIEVQIAESGWLHLARARYRFDGPCRGARLAVAEDKMLTAGGFYDRVGDYAELMRHALAQRSSQRAVVDYSVSYDYGAEINAFAKCFAVCTGEDAAPDWQALGQSTKDAFDTYLKYYDECFVAGHRQNKNTILSRQLAFVIMGIATMYRATGAKSYLEKLKELSDVLLDFEVQFEGIGGEPASAFPYGIHTQRAAWVDGHSSALLALTLARRHLDNPRFTTAIDRGLASYCWETWGGIPRTRTGISTSVSPCVSSTRCARPSYRNCRRSPQNTAAASSCSRWSCDGRSSDQLPSATMQSRSGPRSARAKPTRKPNPG